MKKIKFSHQYMKLLDEHNDVIMCAMLVNVLCINLEEMPSQFLEYDTDNGLYKLPKKGKYLILMFQKPHEDYVCSRDLFTTLRRYTPQKEKYYRSCIGEIMEIVIEFSSPI